MDSVAGNPAQLYPQQSAAISPTVPGDLTLEQLREALEQTRHQLRLVHEQNQKLANASINTTAIIKELERTRNDLTRARKDTESAKKSSLLLTRTIFEGTEDAIIVIQEDGIVKSANQHALRLFELNPDSLGTFQLYDFLIKNYHARHRDWYPEVQRSIKSEGVAHVELCQNEDASNWFEYHFSRFRISNQTHILASARCISNRKKAENRIRLLASVFEHAQDGIIIANLDGLICEVNPKFCHVTGMTRNAIIGLNIRTLAQWTDSSFEANKESALASGVSTGRVNLTVNNPDLSQSGPSYWGTLSTSTNDEQAVSHLILALSDITEIEETQQRLHRQALHDNLTGLPNRRFFKEEIQRLVNENSLARFGVCFLDLDDFKVVNDTLGHEAGDELLNQVSERIKSCIFRDCFLSRFGGDEFALLIPDNGKSNRIQEISTNVVSILNEPFTINDNQVYIGVSIGITVCPDDADEPDSLLRHADLAMYHAKEQGKNTVRDFTPDLAAKIKAGQNLLNELRGAVANRDVKLVYQPKMCLRTNRILDCEALVRWNKDGTAVNPAHFIEAAEKSGLILPLGDQIIEMAMIQAKLWKETGVLEGRIAINLSPRQLNDPEFIERFIELLKKTEAKGSWIELEITENAMMENLDTIRTRIERLNELGVNIAIDDFGTGYSSLSYLRNLPVSTLKIDMTFVRDLPFDNRAVAVAKSVLSLGHGLGLQVVAEGVENIEQQEFLRNAGCDIIQGYLISKPIDAEVFNRLTIQYN